MEFNSAFKGLITKYFSKTLPKTNYRYNIFINDLFREAVQCIMAAWLVIDLIGNDGEGIRPFLITVNTVIHLQCRYQATEISKYLLSGPYLKTELLVRDLRLLPAKSIYVGAQTLQYISQIHSPKCHVAHFRLARHYRRRHKQKKIPFSHNHKILNRRQRFNEVLFF